MKFFIANFFEEKIKPFFLSISLLSIIFFGFYLMRQYESLFLGVFTLIPLVAYIIKVKTIQRAEDLKTLFMPFLIIFCLAIFGNWSKYVTFLDNKFVIGHIQKFVFNTKDLENESYQEEGIKFTPNNPGDQFKCDIISFVLFIVSIGSPISTYYLIENKKKKLKT